MNPFKSIFVVITFSFFMIIQGCGSSGNNGMGNTVYVTASTKSGSTFTIDTTARTAGVYNSGALDFTLRSTVYNNPNGIPASAVNITHAEISYKPLLASDLLTLSPPIATWTRAVGPSQIPAGGTSDITIVLVDLPQMTYLFGLFPDAILQYRYELNVVFIGTEVNSGQSIRCEKTTNNFYVTSGT
jgi:hypothetical protein